MINIYGGCSWLFHIVSYKLVFWILPVARRGEDLETLQGRGHRRLLLDPWIRADRGDVGEMCRGAMATVAEGSGGLVPLRSLS